MDESGHSNRHGRHAGHRFEPDGDVTERLEGREREEAIPADEVVRRLGFSSKGLSVDLGAGTGYFSFPLSEFAGEVLSIDIEPKMLEVMTGRISERAIGNIQLVQGEITSVPLADSSADHVLAAFVYHEVASQKRLLAECARVLRPGGRLDVIDFQKRETSFGPPVGERKSPEHVIRTAGKQFRLESRFETDVFYQLGLSKK